MADIEAKTQPPPTASGFVNMFLVVHRTLDAGSARQAYHAARRAGFDPITAVGIEARVAKVAAEQAKETKIARSEWLADFQAAGAR